MCVFVNVCVDACVHLSVSSCECTHTVSGISVPSLEKSLSGYSTSVHLFKYNFKPLVLSFLETFYFFYISKGHTLLFPPLFSIVMQLNSKWSCYAAVVVKHVGVSVLRERLNTSRHDGCLFVQPLHTQRFM